MTIMFDGVNKLIILSTGTTIQSIKDLWSRWVDWYLTGDNSKYLPAMTQTGGDIIDAVAGTSIPPYIFLQNGWKIRPQEASHTLNITSGILIVAGGGDPFVDPLGAYTIRINYIQPVEAITVNIAGGGASPTDIATAVWGASTTTTTTGSFGELISKKLLTVGKFLGLK